jgi:hypothetical protein
MITFTPMESIFSHSLGHGGTTVSLDELLAGFSTLEELVGSAAEDAGVVADDAGSVAEDVGSAAEELMGTGREAEETPEET